MLYCIILLHIVLLSFVLSNQTRPCPNGPKGTSISRRFSPAMATVSEFHPKSSVVQLCFNAKKNMGMTRQCWRDHSLKFCRHGCPSFLNDWNWNTFMVRKSINMAIFWRIYTVISPDLHESMSLSRNRSVTPWAKNSFGQWKWKSQSPWEKNKERRTSGSPTVPG